MRALRHFLPALCLMFLTTIAWGQYSPPTFRTISPLQVKGRGLTGLDICFATCTAVDADGNIYTAGSFASTHLKLGSITLTNNGGWCAFLAKFDRSLTPLWAKSGSGSDQIVAGLTVGPDQSCHIAINSYSSCSFDGVPFSTISNRMCLVLKFSRNGQMQWQHKIPGIIDNSGFTQAIGTDQQGNVFFAGVLDDGWPDATFFIRKLSATGESLWSRREGKVTQSWGTCVTADNNGNCLVTGSYHGPTTSFGNITLTNHGSKDIFITKYGPSGNVMWSQSAGGERTDEGFDVAVDSNRDCYVAGSTYSFQRRFGGTIRPGTNQVFVAKYRAGGGFVCVKYLPETEEVYTPVRLTVVDSNIYIAAHIPSRDEEDVLMPSFLAAMDLDGNELWRKQIEAFGTSVEPSGNRAFWPISRVVADSASNLYFTGSMPLVDGYAEFDSFTFDRTNACNFLAKLSFDPVLKSTRNGNQVVLSWPTNEAGFVLEATSTVGGTNWQPVLTQPFVAGGEYRFISNLTGAKRFFRLRK